MSRSSPLRSTGAGGPSHDEQMQMSLLGGVARPEDLPQADDADFAHVDDKGGGLSQSTILILVVIAIAVGSLYAMRLTQGEVSTAGTEQAAAKIEQTLIKLGTPEAMAADDPLNPDNIEALFSETDEITAMLDVDRTAMQIPASQLKQNPFDLGISDESSNVGMTERERQQQIDRLSAELDRLSLQSVMGGGASAIAVIDGEFYQIGQTVGSFRITAIDGVTLSIELAAADHTFTLRMGD